MLCYHGLAVRIALVEEADRWHVIIHEVTVAAQMASPKIATHFILRDGLCAWIGHDIPGVAVGAVPHVRRVFQDARARLGGVRWPRGFWVVEVMHVFCSNGPRIVFMARLLLIVLQ